MVISEKKQAIFISTINLIKDHGFHGTPMSLVAKNAGVAAGTIYHYFDSKDQLICELYDFCKNEFLKVIEVPLNNENLDFKKRFEAICRSIFEFYVKAPNILIFFEQYINSPYQNDKSQINTNGILFSFFKTGIEQKIIKQVKPEIVMVLVLGNIATLAKIKAFSNNLQSLEDLEQSIKIIWDGIAA